MFALWLLRMLHATCFGAVVDTPELPWHPCCARVLICPISVEVVSASNVLSLFCAFTSSWFLSRFLHARNHVKHLRPKRSGTPHLIETSDLNQFMVFWSCALSSRFFPVFASLRWMTVCCFCDFRLLKGLIGELSLFSGASSYGLLSCLAGYCEMPLPVQWDVWYFLPSTLFVVLCSVVSRASRVCNGLALLFGLMIVSSETRCRHLWSTSTRHEHSKSVCQHCHQASQCSAVILETVHEQWRMRIAISASLKVVQAVTHLTIPLHSDQWFLTVTSNHFRVTWISSVTC